jgi:predicted Co/Zn/Cd cation transporter (cation efflux family)
MGGASGSLRFTDTTVPTRRLWLAAGVVLLNIADVLLTKAVLHHGGVEANPMMAGLMGGFAAPLGLKMVVAGVAGILLLLCPPDAKLGERAVTAVVALYSVIVVWNTVVLGLLALR